MTTYFGSPTGVVGGALVSPASGGAWAQYQTDSAWNYTTTYGGAVKFTCPGSGSKTITSLQAYIKTELGASNARMAIYTTTDGDLTTLIAQGTAEFAIGEAGWQGHIGAANITPNPATLTGGNEYLIAVTFDASGSVYGNIYAVTLTNGSVRSYNDYTGGFSSGIAGDIGQSQDLWVACGLADEAADLSIWASECVGSSGHLA